MLDLQTLADDFAAAVVAADARRPVAVNQRTNETFQPGIGPHSESATVDLAVAELKAADPERYPVVNTAAPYPTKPRRKCDLAFGGMLHIEVKLLRLLGDNGKLNDNMLMHILSPYSQHRSAVTDCEKLRASGFAGRKAILILGYAYPDWPLDPAIDAFEVIARRGGEIGPRHSATFIGLCHPVHRAGAVFVWEVT